MKINKQTLEQFRKDFAETVSALEKKYDLDISLGSITFEDNEFHGKLTARKKGLTNVEWNTYCSRYGFEPEDLGKTFIYGRKEYTITGIKPGTKYPITTIREDGKKFSFTPDAIKENM